MKKQIIDAVPAGADWFDAVIVTGRSTPLDFKNNRLHSVNEKENSGAGVRINIDGRTGFSYTNDSERIGEAVKRSAGLAPFCDKESFSLPADVSADFEPYDEALSSFDLKDEIGRAEETIEAIQKVFPSITIDMGIGASTGSFRLINSEGIDVSYRDSLYSVGISCTYITGDGNKIDTWESTSSMKPVDFSRLKDSLIRKVEYALTAAGLAPGRYPVILPPSAFARLLGIVASGFNGVSVWKGVSPLADKMGQKVFSESLTMIDDPQIPGSPYNVPFDGEGVKTGRKYLINKGVVETFITDLKYAERLNMEPSGNAARGYSSLPSPSFTGIAVEGGSLSVEEMIASVDRGIIVEQFIGLGQSNTLTGDFSANLDLAYLVEGGKITGRLKDCMLSGNIYDLLNGDISLSSERERRGSSLMPHALFGGMDFSA